MTGPAYKITTDVAPEIPLCSPYSQGGADVGATPPQIVDRRIARHPLVNGRRTGDGGPAVARDLAGSQGWSGGCASVVGVGFAMAMGRRCVRTRPFRIGRGPLDRPHGSRT